MQTSLTVENMKRNTNKIAYDIVSLNYDSLTTKLKNKVSEQYGQYFVSPTSFLKVKDVNHAFEWPSFLFLVSFYHRSPSIDLQFSDFVNDLPAQS